jgi:hypothetical protein
MRVVGSKHHHAREAFDAGVLRAGVAVLIRHQPNNGHDPNAYEVLCADYRIGHISRFAAAILRAARAPAVMSSVVSSVWQDGKSLEIRIAFNTGIESAPANFRLGTPTAADSGIYAIVNVYDMRAYIGKSKDMEQRRRQHLAKLQRGLHPSWSLQADWRNSPQRFAFVTVKAVSVDLLDSQEILALKTYGTNDIALGYNQGEGFSPISDPSPEAEPDSEGGDSAQENTPNTGGQRPASDTGREAISGSAAKQPNRPFAQVLQPPTSGTPPLRRTQSGPRRAPKPAGCGCVVMLVPLLAGLSMAFASMTVTRRRPAEPVVTALAPLEAER